MHSNLIPPFIMRVGGVIGKDTPKIHCKTPTLEDHLISFVDIDLRIKLQLKGIFSIFHHRVSTSDELQGCDKVFLTPDSTSWNPYCESFNALLSREYSGTMPTNTPLNGAGKGCLLIG